MKKILVVDIMSDSCFTCQFFKFKNKDNYNSKVTVCTLKGGYVNENGIDTIASWCPLKPIPSKEELIRKILFEVDGGTDDRFISYSDICRRVEQSVNDWFEELERD